MRTHAQPGVGRDVRVHVLRITYPSHDPLDLQDASQSIELFSRYVRDLSTMAQPLL